MTAGFLPNPAGRPQAFGDERPTRVASGQQREPIARPLSLDAVHEMLSGAGLVIGLACGRIRDAINVPLIPKEDARRVLDAGLREAYTALGEAIAALERIAG
jgi:hypothetical protein